MSKLFSGFLCEDLGLFSAVNYQTVKLTAEGQWRIQQRATEKIEMTIVLFP